MPEKQDYEAPTGYCSWMHTSYHILGAWMVFVGAETRALPDTVSIRARGGSRGGQKDREQATRNSSVAAHFARPFPAP
jgi:hypothetical protein